MKPIGSMRHEDFTIGEAFWTAGGPYRCTDVGTRTIVAVHLGPRMIVQQESVGDEHRATTVVVDDPSWLNGPPYAVAEVVFDEDDLADCYRRGRPTRGPGRLTGVRRQAHRSPHQPARSQGIPSSLVARRFPYRGAKGGARAPGEAWLPCASDFPHAQAAIKPRSLSLEASLSSRRKSSYAQDLEVHSNASGVLCRGPSGRG